MGEACQRAEVMRALGVHREYLPFNDFGLVSKGSEMQLFELHQIPSTR